MKGKVKKWEDNCRRTRRFVTFSNFDTMGKAEVFFDMMSQRVRKIE